MTRRRYLFDPALGILDRGEIDDAPPIVLTHWRARMLCADWRNAGVLAGPTRAGEHARARFLELHEALAADRAVRRAA